MMGSGSLLAFALLLSLAIAVLRILWLFLLAVLVLGPPTFAGIAASHFIGSALNSIAAGMAVAIVVAGVLSDLSRGALHQLWEAR
ncbi:MAG: hypothetical protein ACT4OF_12445 [Caulobacteraceae bacterium]